MEGLQFKQLLKILKDINQNLSILVSLQKYTSKPPKLGSEENTVLKLCNGKNNATEMAKITDKSKHNIEVVLGGLRKKGLIKSTKINRKTVYVKF